MRDFDIPYLIAPFDFINQPNATVLFTVKQSSPYEAYWSNYPRRRVIPLEETDVEPAVEPQSDDPDHC
jgi:hypothetical protein